MMRQIDLLPQAHAERARARRSLGMAVVAGMTALMLLVAWWFMIGGQVSSARNELADVEATNLRLESQIAELQRFAELEAEAQAKEVALQTVMAGDVAWPSILTEIAMVLPSEIWLTEIQGSAGFGQDATQVGTETAPVRVSSKTPVGRIQFQGASLTMPGVAKWLISLGDSKKFAAEWLDLAAESTTSGDSATEYFEFTSTIELINKAASGRYQKGMP